MLIKIKVPIFYGYEVLLKFIAVKKETRDVGKQWNIESNEVSFFGPKGPL